MGRHKTGDSERDYLRQLALERRKKLPAEREARDLRIVAKARLGIEYKDIARQYGLTGDYIGCLLKRRRDAGKESTRVGSGNPRGIGRYGSALGID